MRQNFPRRENNVEERHYHIVEKQEIEIYELQSPLEDIFITLLER